MAASNCIIAIVEDDASLRRALERLLCASGFGVHTFASAEEFFGSAVPELYGCLILDISAPKEVGFRLIRRSHRVWPTPAGDLRHRAGRDNARQQASRIPNSVYLHKPVVGAVLLEVIRSLLNGCSAGAESRENVRPSAVHPIFP